MMKLQRLYRWILPAVASLFFFVFCLYLALPAGKIDSFIGNLLALQGLKLTPQLRKTVLPGVAWDNLLLSSEQGDLIRCDTLRVRPLLLPLMMGHIALESEAHVGAGYLNLEYSRSGSRAVELSADGINLTDIPFFTTVLGAKAAGTLWSRGTLQRSAKGVNGDIKLEVRQLEFSGVKLGAFPLPDAAGLTNRGIVRFTNNAARLESFTLEGDGIYMRLSGNLPTGNDVARAPLALTLEIMPKAEFLDKQKLVFMLLAKFMTSPGVYTIPVRGTLLKPVIF
ncbi:MAG TPA: type II secretion system protein GspN [Desulfuromonadales bacterium]|nr:type II secretion system protein GspN [Desulfuromonadales bacterium]